VELAFLALNEGCSGLQLRGNTDDRAGSETGAIQYCGGCSGEGLTHQNFKRFQRNLLTGLIRHFSVYPPTTPRNLKCENWIDHSRCL